MLIIADYRIPAQAKARLADFGEVLLLQTYGITYDAIAGHPDIFLCQTPAALIVAPNTPYYITEALTRYQIKWVWGDKPVGKVYPHTALYNAWLGKNTIIHKTGITDKKILECNPGLKKISVNQAYTRCNAFEIKGTVITSDLGIQNQLMRAGISVSFFEPRDILLEGFEHGFLGGCCGLYENKIWICGSLAHYTEGNRLRLQLEALGMEIMELYDGPLVDIGSIMFFPCDGLMLV